MAKDQKQEPSPPPAPDAPAVAAPPKSYRLYIVLGFVSLILFQVIFVFLLIPAKPIPPPVGVQIGDDYGQTEGLTGDPIPSKPTVSLQIGEKNTFKFSDTRDGNNEVFSFQLYVNVEKADEYKYTTQYNNRSIEIIDAIASAMRATTQTEREEAGYTAIKEKIKRTINDILPVPYVRRVFFVEPSYTVN